ncbi:MAG TPA: hypothetical protein VN962_09960 [Polyangia bacterium]|nr:hypothetical protein [Polyangia bacterium]
MKSRMLLGAALLASGCVPAALPGQEGVPLGVANRPQKGDGPPQPLQVSASEAPNFSTAYLGLVEVTFENRTPVWKEVVRVAVDFGSPARNKSVTIATADEIDAWERAIKLRAPMYGAAPSTAVERWGLGALVDTLGTRVDAHPRDTPAAETAATSPPPAYPDQHLLTTPFRVPPGLFTKRWILLSTPDDPAGGCIDSMILTYETSDHEMGRVALPFKISPSDWQPQACARLMANPNGNQ